MNKVLSRTLATIMVLNSIGDGAGQNAAGGLLRVVEGGRAANVIGTQTAVTPVVELRDSGGKPVAGAEISFLFPETGPRVRRPDNQNPFRTRTDGEGLAKAGEVIPIEVGSFEIVVRSTVNGSELSTTLNQTNYATASDMPQTGRSPSERMAEYKIQILEGDDGVNIINKKTAVRTVVRVVDKNNLPVAAVPVVVALVLTRGGGEGAFAKGETSVRLVTDAKGIAEAPSFIPTKNGSVQIRIEAVVQGSTIERSISQTNFSTVKAAAKAGKTPGSSAPAETSEVAQSAKPDASTVAKNAGKASGKASSAASSGSTAGAATGGISAVQVLGIASGGLLAAGGIAKAAGVGSSDTQKDCSSPIAAFSASLQTASSCIQAARDPVTQCRNQIQAFLNAEGAVCTCGGGSAAIPQEFRNFAAQVQSAYQQLGFSYPSSCAR